MDIPGVRDRLQDKLKQGESKLLGGRRPEGKRGELDRQKGTAFKKGDRVYIVTRSTRRDGAKFETITEVDKDTGEVLADTSRFTPSPGGIPIKLSAPTDGAVEDKVADHRKTEERRRAEEKKRLEDERKRKERLRQEELKELKDRVDDWFRENPPKPPKPDDIYFPVPDPDTPNTA